MGSCESAVSRHSIYGINRRIDWADLYVGNSLVYNSSCEREYS